MLLLAQTEFDLRCYHCSIYIYIHIHVCVYIYTYIYTLVIVGILLCCFTYTTIN